MFTLKEIISLRTKMSQRQIEYEKRLSRLEAIMHLYFLKSMPEDSGEYNSVRTTSYLEDAEIEIFGKNFVARARSSEEHTPVKKQLKAREKGTSQNRNK